MFFVKTFSFTIAYVDPDIAGKRVGENNTQLVSWHWTGDDESILPIVTSNVDMTILSIVNAAIAGLSAPSRTIREFWGSREDPNQDGGLYACNVTTIFDTNTAAGWVKAGDEIRQPNAFLRRLSWPTSRRYSWCPDAYAWWRPVATFLWMTSSHLQLRIWSMISWRNRMMKVRRGALIEAAFRWRKQASKSLNVSYKRGSSDSSNPLKWSDTMLLVSLPIISEALLLMRM